MRVKSKLIYEVEELDESSGSVPRVVIKGVKVETHPCINERGTADPRDVY